MIDITDSTYFKKHPEALSKLKGLLATPTQIIQPQQTQQPALPVVVPDRKLVEPPIHIPIPEPPKAVLPLDKTLEGLFDKFLNGEMEESQVHRGVDYAVSKTDLNKEYGTEENPYEYYGFKVHPDGSIRWHNFHPIVAMDFSNAKKGTTHYRVLQHSAHGQEVDSITKKRIMELLKKPGLYNGGVIAVDEEAAKNGFGFRRPNIHFIEGKVSYPTKRVETAFEKFEKVKDDKDALRLLLEDVGENDVSQFKFRKVNSDDELKGKILETLKRKFKYITGRSPDLGDVDHKQVDELVHRYKNYNRLVPYVLDKVVVDVMRTEDRNKVRSLDADVRRKIENKVKEKVYSLVNKKEVKDADRDKAHAIDIEIPDELLRDKIQENESTIPDEVDDEGNLIYNQDKEAYYPKVLENPSVKGNALLNEIPLLKNMFIPIRGKQLWDHLVDHAKSKSREYADEVSWFLKDFTDNPTVKNYNQLLDVYKKACVYPILLLMNATGLRVGTNREKDAEGVTNIPISGLQLKPDGVIEYTLSGKNNKVAHGSFKNKELHGILEEYKKIAVKIHSVIKQHPEVIVNTPATKSLSVIKNIPDNVGDFSVFPEYTRGDFEDSFLGKGNYIPVDSPEDIDKLQGVLPPEAETQTKVDSYSMFPFIRQLLKDKYNVDIKNPKFLAKYLPIHPHTVRRLVVNRLAAKISNSLAKHMFYNAINNNSTQSLSKYIAKHKASIHVPSAVAGIIGHSSGISKEVYTAPQLIETIFERTLDKLLDEYSKADDTDKELIKQQLQRDLKHDNS
jgi:hypothetical protein